MAINTVVSIGCLGNIYNYVNVPREEAIKRYLARNDDEELGRSDHVQEWTFTDEFISYDGGFAP